MKTISRPVVAFALLKQCSESLSRDLLTGVTILIRPLVMDLAGTEYDAVLLALRLKEAYGLSVPVKALEDFASRLTVAGILTTIEMGANVSRHVYAVHEEQIEIPEEEEFQQIIDDFLSHAKEHLHDNDVGLSDDELTTSFLSHLSTLDFSAIRARPTIGTQKTSGIIEGPETKEKRATSEQLKQSAAIDVLVASYIGKLNAHNPERLILLSSVADGALGLELVLDLQAPTSVPRLDNVTVIIDTPILLSYLDLSSVQECKAAQELIQHIKATGAKIAAYQHSIVEAEGVLGAIQSARVVGEAYGPTVARLSNSTYRAFFESMVKRISYTWTQKHNFDLIQESNPAFYKHFSEDDEGRLTALLQENLLDRRLTRERDAKSVAETMRRLAGAYIPSSQVAACKYIFVTQNRPLQRKSAKFLQNLGLIDAGSFVPIVTDRYIAGLCWLVLGGAATQSPSVARLLANCTAALRLRPELADRTKRFLSQLDEEKALHFESLMTNERASQYLMEATFGNPDVITASNVEEIYEEILERAAEHIAKEKDTYYSKKITHLNAEVTERDKQLAALRGKVTTLSLDRDAGDHQVRVLEREAKSLGHRVEEQQTVLDGQNKKIDELETVVNSLSEFSQNTRQELERTKERVKGLAKKAARRAVLAWKIGGIITFVLLSSLLGYFDKFIVSTLPTGMQNYGNWAVIGGQVFLAIATLGVMLDFLFAKYLKSAYAQAYSSKLLEFGIDEQNSHL